MKKLCLIAALASPVFAQDMPDHAHMNHGDMAGMDMDMPMTGVLGGYDMSREASGTSWQPDSTPHDGIHASAGAWSVMVHGMADFVVDHQGGPRGDDKTFVASMMMVMANRPVGDTGKLGFRAMLSLDPLMGRRGYPLLFATGETANGKDELVDRQHPHDLFMELSASYSFDLGENKSIFLYGGLPGEPAIGPPAFMHRYSAMANPEAPITHHWLDSTHITFGVLTAGYVQDKWKLEVSGFKGREPDEKRYDIEKPKIDSYSARLSFNPTDDWSMQVSAARFHSPEQLHPEDDETRITASVSYNRPFGENNIWSSTFAWGQKRGHENRLNGFIFESTVALNEKHHLFGRAEHVQEAELFDAASPLAGGIYAVTKLSLGYEREFKLADHASIGFGGLGSVYAFPSRLNADYGSGPKSWMLFARLRIM